MGAQAYERPENPELVLKTIEKSVEDCVQQIVAQLEHNRILPKMRTMVSGWRKRCENWDRLVLKNKQTHFIVV